MVIAIFRWGICVIYSGLTIFACVNSLQNNISKYWVNILLGLGGILLVILNINKLKDKFLVLILVLIVIQFCAIMNGYYLGNINILHHIVRLALHIAIFALFYFSVLQKKQQERLNKIRPNIAYIILQLSVLVIHLQKPCFR